MNFLDHVDKISSTPAPAPCMPFDENSSSKRRIRRGSDPIHNRVIIGAEVEGGEREQLVDQVPRDQFYEPPRSRDS
ncbi:hypothetical protein Dimus_023967, partial [Dionaea muscipula]